MAHTKDSDVVSLDGYQKDRSEHRDGKMYQCRRGHLEPVSLGYAIMWEVDGHTDEGNVKGGIGYAQAGRVGQASECGDTGED
jgi:hypothetical protein